MNFLIWHGKSGKLQRFLQSEKKFSLQWSGGVFVVQVLAEFKFPIFMDPICSKICHNSFSALPGVTIEWYERGVRVGGVSEGLVRVSPVSPG